MDAVATTESFFDKITPQEMEDLEEYLYEITDELFEDEIIHMSKPNFLEIITDNIKEHFREQWLDQGICNEPEYEEICEYIDTFLDRIFDSLESEIPKRQYFDTEDAGSTPIVANIAQKIETLKAAPQPEQKSAEWYELRHNLITASNVHKLLGSELQRNSLIYEKCKPLTIETHHNYFANANNSRQWGIIYEPLSVKIYEKIYQTKVDNFGCIRHPHYTCLGASPDGINVDPKSARYGRMIEVKNIVNRDITGIPKEEHWVQMQIQMETCDLDECDFIETRFKEFETSEEFYHFPETADNHWSVTWRGVFLCFLEKVTSETANTLYVPRFEYLPMDIPIEREQVEAWIEATCAKHKDTHTLYTTHYWYLDEFSCILVKRNRMWFKAVIPKILETWQTIEEERQSGYEHRAAKKRPVIPMPNVHIAREVQKSLEENGVEEAEEDNMETELQDENVRIVSMRK